MTDRGAVSRVMPPEGSGGTRGPAVLSLTDRRATDPAISGSKAANVARAAAADLPIVPGFVLTTGATSTDGSLDDTPGLRGAWEELTEGGRRPVVVRSSSTVEDAQSSSMAGQFDSVLGVQGWDDFTAAVRQVLASATSPAARAGGRAVAPMAVLVQLEVAPSVSGVLFGVDPVTGDGRHMVTDVVAGSPHPLVSGEVSGDRYVLSHAGRIASTTDSSRALLPMSRRRSLARLGHSAQKVFGGPQDIEWAFDGDGQLRLLQSRPVTAVGHGRARGPLLGPGPVAETFPRPLRRLEADLWAAPLRSGIADALRTVGAASEHRLAASPVVVLVGGWVAVDLDLLGVAPTNHRILRALDPRGPFNRLTAAWRVGKLRASLPELAADAIRLVDSHLRAVPPLRELSDVQLVGLLRNGVAELVALHSHEVVAGMLAPSAENATTGAAVALSTLARARGAGLSDAEIVACHPIVLSLTAPRIGPPEPLPGEVRARPGGGELSDLGPASPALTGALGPREALRLRVRWVQELMARAATELGGRLAQRGQIPDVEAVGHLTLDEVVAAVDTGDLPDDLAHRSLREAPPLPPTFRLTKSGQVVTVVARRHTSGGRAAGGGRGVGPVRHWDGSTPEPGDVLVVATLGPELAPVLPGLHGLVSETGSPLAHLAILAREFGVPTVVGLPDACRRFPPGASVVVDGDTGEVALMSEQELTA